MSGVDLEEILDEVLLELLRTRRSLPRIVFHRKGPPRIGFTSEGDLVVCAPPGKEREMEDHLRETGWTQDSDTGFWSKLIH